MPSKNGNVCDSVRQKKWQDTGVDKTQKLFLAEKHLGLALFPQDLWSVIHLIETYIESSICVRGHGRQQGWLSVKGSHTLPSPLHSFFAYNIQDFPYLVARIQLRYISFIQYPCTLLPSSALLAKAEETIFGRQTFGCITYVIKEL